MRSMSTKNHPKKNIWTPHPNKEKTKLWHVLATSGSWIMVLNPIKSHHSYRTLTKLRTAKGWFLMLEFPLNPHEKNPLKKSPLKKNKQIPNPIVFQIYTSEKVVVFLGAPVIPPNPRCDWKPRNLPHLSDEQTPSEKTPWETGCSLGILIMVRIII